MEFIKTSLKDCFIVEPDIFKDTRGCFHETFNQKKYEDGLQRKLKFVQDNCSVSSKHVLRGMHFQNKNPQGKLVMVTFGEVLDVAVDLRKNSNTYGNWYSVILSDLNRKQLWIPEGFAHGFLVLSEFAHFSYKCTTFYDPTDEICLKWNDKDISINWACKNPIISNKDSNGLFFRDIEKII